MEKLVKSNQGWRIEGRQKYTVQGFEHEITWMRYVNDKEVQEFLRRK